MTLPTMVVKGLVTASPYPELEGKCYISSSSGFLATIEFEGKRTLGLGTKNGFQARIDSLRENQTLFEVNGQWSGEMKVRDALKKKDLDDFNVDNVPTMKVRLKPIEEQSLWESRRAWKDVLQGIRDGDTEAVAVAKDHIEEGQRAMRAAEEKVGVEWPRLFFQRAEDHQEYQILAQALPAEASISLDAARTAGVWRFIGIGAAEALLSSGGFHEGLEPAGQLLLKGQQA